MEHPEGTSTLVLGILGLVCCSVFGPLAWAQGRMALREIDAHPGAYTNRQTINVGRIIGMVVTCLLGAVVGGYAIFSVVMIIVTG